MACGGEPELRPGRQGPRESLVVMEELQHSSLHVQT